MLTPPQRHAGWKAAGRGTVLFTGGGALVLALAPSRSLEGQPRTAEGTRSWGWDPPLWVVPLPLGPFVSALNQVGPGLLGGGVHAPGLRAGSRLLVTGGEYT